MLRFCAFVCCFLFVFFFFFWLDVRCKDHAEGCTLEYMTQSDPRGWIPKWVTNSVTGTLAPKVGLGLKKEFPFLTKQTKSDCGEDGEGELIVVVDECFRFFFKKNVFFSRLLEHIPPGWSRTPPPSQLTHMLSTNKKKEELFFSPFVVCFQEM
jgi:hypothetical protein